MVTVIREGLVPCPYCSKMLEKAPGSKKKCPNCNNFIYVKTRPSDRKRVMATKAEVEKIEEEWSIVKGYHKEYLQEKAKYETARNQLRKKFGREPSEADIKWSLYNNYLIQHANNGNWGLYTNIKIKMGDLLKKEKKHLHALLTYFEVCYLDVNGPCNSGEPGKPFKPSTGSLAPGIINYINKLIKKIDMDKSAAKNFFLIKILELNKRLIYQFQLKKVGQNYIRN